MKLRTIIIIVVVIVIIGAGGFYFWQQQNATTRAASAVQTVQVARGTLAATVAGAGNLIAPQQTTLAFQQTGVQINKINVKIGDQVKAGDVLAQADDTNLQYALTTATNNLKSAQASLDALNQPPAQADVDTAQAQVASAQANYDAAVAKYAHNNDQITVAKAALDKATIALQQAQAAYDRISWQSNVGMSSQAAALQSATIDYQSALANYNLTVTGINDTAVKSAAQALESAKANLAKLTAPPTAQALAQAQAQVDSAQAALDQAKRNLNQAKVIAPFDGTIAAVNYVVGQMTSNTAAFTLVNLDNLETQVNISEVDIPNVKVGQEVELAFDALNGRQSQGKVASISPVGTVTQGVVNYLVTVSLTRTNPSIMPGMTTEATITTARKDNVVMVPNRAVKTQNNQRFIVELQGGQQIPLVIQTGLTDGTNTEITAAFEVLPDGTRQQVNLDAGDVLVVPSTSTTTTPRGPGGGGGFFLGRGG